MCVLMPTSLPFSPQKKGPPLSPWQESLPPSSRPAQIIESATEYPLAPYELAGKKHKGYQEVKMTLTHCNPHQKPLERSPCAEH